MKKKVEININDLMSKVKDIDLQANDPGHILYFEFLKYFEDRKEITKHDFLIAISFTYSWMPTMLWRSMKVCPDIDRAAKIIQQVRKSREELDTSKLSKLKDVINNSLIGTSKVLHFASPELYPIVDSRVCKYLNNNIPMNSPCGYLSYCSECRNVIASSEFLRLSKIIKKETIFNQFTSLRVV
jgi:hypothetical protein